MTELNDDHGPETAQPTPEWPEPAAEHIGDPVVAAILAALGGVQRLPVAEHEAVYGQVHDDLLRALNEDAPPGGNGA